MKRTQLKQFAVCLLTTALSISCTGELSIEVQDWIKLPDEEIELDIKNRARTVTVSSKVAWTAASDVDWLAIEPSRGYAGETEVTITSTFEEDKETSGAIVFNSSQAGNFKETRLPVKHETLVADWITLPGKAVELDIKNNSKTVVVSSKVNWTAVSDADWLVFEPSSGKAGETEVKITSTLNEDKENSGTIMFSSSDAGNLKDIQLTVTQTTLITDWITLPEEAVELDIKNNSSTVTIISETAWTATSGVDWLTLEPSSGNAGTTEVKISSTLNKDVGSSGSITFNSSEEGHFKEKQLQVKQVALKTDWMTLPGGTVELDIKNNVKTVTVSSTVGWTATSDDNWIVIEPSRGNAGTTKVRIISTLNEDKIASGTITFDSSEEGHFKEKKLTVKTVLSTTLPDVDLLLSIKSPTSSITLTTAYGWKIESCPEWLTATPSQGSRTTNIKLSLKSSRYDCHEEGEIVIVDDNSDRVSVNVSQIKYFDAAFAQVLQDKGYIPNAYKIDLDIIKGIEVLTINRSKLTNLTGIEFFKSLKELDCSDNKLTSLDLSNNTSLTSLDCSHNALEDLNISKNINLISLNVNASYYLTNLDISKNTNLTYLYCNNNHFLTNLDISKNVNLTFIDCFSCKLASLDVSKNTRLTELQCDCNQLTNLDVSKSTNLTKLQCGWNQLTNLDVSKNTNLTELSCPYNKLTNLDIVNNVKLVQLICKYNQLTNLNVRKNTKLRSVRCENNQLSNLDISSNTEMEFLHCGNNPGNGSKFPVKVWFNTSNWPPNFRRPEISSWEYNGNTITIDFYK